MSTSEGLYILGFGGHARSVADVAVSIGCRHIAFVDKNVCEGESFGAFPTMKALPEPSHEAWQLFPASGDNQRRAAQIQAASLPVATLISPRASIGIESRIEAGTLVCHGAHIGPGSTLGAGVIVNTHAVIEHEVQVGDFTHISVNATIAGRSKIGSYVMVGAGAVVIDSVCVCSNVVIGAGAVVVSDIGEPGVYVGVPARKIKTL
ncbi:NeuD/PglB/VioB family sugar acetyltransferase [Acetobacter orientalis]|uniref:NeuD/PglB/VioB family sugar acetyltransferase n=1 Tax=Acetobacter orientalis TaxID=146474 RepID=UPI003865FB6A